MTYKNQKEIDKEIDKIRKKFGKPPLREIKTYNQRLEEYKKNE